MSVFLITLSILLNVLDGSVISSDYFFDFLFDIDEEQNNRKEVLIRNCTGLEVLRPSREIEGSGYRIFESLLISPIFLNEIALAL